MRAIVVGAGLAGLVSGLRLQESAHDVVVLEARDRVGGRVLTLRDGLAEGQYVDAGAEIVYAGQHEIVWLCERFGLPLTPEMHLGTELPSLLFDGRRLDRAESAAVVGHLRERYGQVPPAAFESVAAWAARARVGRWTRSLLEAVVQSTPVVPLRFVDACEFNPHLGWGEGYRKLEGGSDVLPRRLAQELDVRLADPVRTVAWSGGEVVVETEATTHRGDVAVIAVPGPLTTGLGFEPPLPVDHVRALHALRYGTGARLALQYAEGAEVRAAMQAGAFTDRLPSWLLDGSVHQAGGAIVLTSVLGGDHEPRLVESAALLAEADETLSLLVGRPLTRMFGTVLSWSADEWARCVVRAPAGDERETLLPRLRAPLGDRVFFAGEHTDDRVGPGGMEGAIRSAHRVAREVLASRFSNPGRASPSQT